MVVRYALTASDDDAVASYESRGVCATRRWQVSLRLRMGAQHGSVTAE